MKCRSIVLAGLGIFGWVGFTQAQPSHSSFKLNGFIAQGVIQATHTNFVNDNGKLSTALSEFGLNGGVTLNQNWHVSGQISYQNNGNRFTEGARVDYLFAEYETQIHSSWNVGVQLGRFKNDHFLYSATRDIPHTRPSIVLPQSKYYDGFRDTALSSDGLAWRASRMQDWGDLEFRWSRGQRDFNDKERALLLSPLPQGKIDQPFVEQAGLYVNLAEYHFTFTINYLDSKLRYLPTINDPFFAGFNRFNQWMAIVTYSGKRFDIASEFFTQSVVVRDFFVPGYNDSTRGAGAYLQYRYHFNQRFKGFIRGDWYVRNVADSHGKRLQQRTGLPAYFGYQHMLSTGIEYHFTDTLALQAELHGVRGTARLTPALFPNTAINDREDWAIYALQLMYSF